MFNSYATWYQTQMANKQANKRYINYPFAQIRHHLRILPLVSLRTQKFPAIPSIPKRQDKTKWHRAT